MSDKYILDGHKAVLCADLIRWARWFEDDEKRRVALDVTPNNGKVSTVFLGLDHNYTGRGEPILFETMVFGGPRDQEQVRYSTWEEAEAGHRQIVGELQKTVNQ